MLPTVIPRLAFRRLIGATGGGGTPAGPTLDPSLEAPTLALANGQTTYPPQYTATLPAWPTGDTDKLEFQSDGDWQFGSPEIDSTSVITNAEATGGSKTISGLSGITSGVTYGRVRGIKVSNNTCSAWSNIVGHGDTTAPVISTSATASVNEQDPLSLALSADKPCSFAIVAGADMAQFQIDGPAYGTQTLAWAADGSQTYSAPADAGADNVYNVTVRATDYFGNTADLSEAVTVVQLDLSPDAFNLGDQSGAALSTQYASNVVTFSGISAGRAASGTVSAGQYSLNGGAWTAAGTISVHNGDTLQVRGTSSASYSTATNIVVTIGSTSDTFTITTEANPSVPGFTPSTAQPANIVLSFGQTTGTFTGVDFATGTAVIYTRHLGNKTVSAVTVNGVAATMQASILNGLSPNQFLSIWTAPVAAGSVSVAVTLSSNAGDTVGILCGTLTNITSATPTGTASKAFTTSGQPFSTTTALTVGSASVGVAFLETPSTGISAATGTMVSTGGLGGQGYIATQLAAGSWMPTFAATGGTNNNGILAGVWA